MQLVDVPHGPVEEFGSSGVWIFSGPSPEVASQVRVHTAHFEPGGTIGPHPTGRWQVFWVLYGSGRVVGAEGDVLPVSAGQAAIWAPGEDHQSWADEPMTVMIVQSEDEPVPPV